MLEAKDIGVPEIKKFFNMDGPAMLKEWRALNEAERDWFKAAIAEWCNNHNNGSKP